MADRTGAETDRAAIAELFRDEEALGRRIVEDYLEPRAKRNAREKLLDRRDHFWSVPPATPRAKPSSTDPTVLLVERTMRALADEAFVGKAVAAIYCGCSEVDLDRRVRSLGGLTKLAEQGETELRRKTDAQGNPLPGKVNERRFRMTAVRRLRKTRATSKKSGAPATAPSETESTSESLHRSDAEVSLRVVISESGLTITLPRALLDRVPWVKDKNGDLVCHLTVAGFAPAYIADVLANGGGVERLTLREALGRPWTTVEERQPWATGYATVLAREASALSISNAVTADRELASSMGTAIVAGGGTRF